MNNECQYDATPVNDSDRDFLERLKRNVKIRPFSERDDLDHTGIIVAGISVHDFIRLMAYLQSHVESTATFAETMKELAAFDEQRAKSMAKWDKAVKDAEGKK